MYSLFCHLLLEVLGGVCFQHDWAVRFYFFAGFGGQNTNNEKFNYFCAEGIYSQRRIDAHVCIRVHTFMMHSYAQVHESSCFSGIKIINTLRDSRYWDHFTGTSRRPYLNVGVRIFSKEAGRKEGRKRRELKSIDQTRRLRRRQSGLCYYFSKPRLPASTVSPSNK